ncbi:MAG: TerC family protein [Alphaproteobacteria bacterium]|nr:TerC family protein [Alphaproteobacteria bacterium]
MTLFWILFIIGLIFFLLLDLGVFHKENKIVSLKSAFYWTFFWFVAATCFAIGIYFFVSPQKCLEFATGYLLEQSLSIDNIFVFVLLFKRFHIPAKYQYRVLYWGVFGALIMRALMILLGIELLNQFAWMIYVFGAFLIYTGIKMLFAMPSEDDIGEHAVLKWMRNHFNITKELHEEKFFMRIDSKLYLTPLFIVLLLIEITDLIFAFDSIPAILGITRDPFIVYTSNCFAILGLRSLYFVLAKMVDRFKLLHYGLGIVLAFVGFKMIASHFFELPIWFTLGFIVVVLTASVLLSLVRTKHVEN